MRFLLNKLIEYWKSVCASFHKPEFVSLSRMTWKIRRSFREVCRVSHRLCFGKYRGRINISTLQSDYNFFEVDQLMLHGMFQLLVDYVEIQCAWMKLISDERYKALPWFDRMKISLHCGYRSRSLGIEYLNWEISLKEEHSGQAKVGQIVKDLYIWWKDIRPCRPNPGDVYHFERLDDVIKIMTKTGATRTKEENKLMKEFEERSKKSEKLEQRYHAEDTKMMKLLLEERSGLWT